MPVTDFPLLRCHSMKDGEGWAGPLDLHYSEQFDYVEISLVVAGGRAVGKVAATIQLPTEQVRILRERLNTSLTYTCPACRAAAALNLTPEKVLGAHTCGR
jgi:hypothetical protein